MHSNTRQALPSDYQPGMYDVICGRGKTCYRHHGNLHMRNIVASYAEEYSQATTKNAKSTIVSSVIQELEALGRGFVKEHCGSWHRVTLSHAREKVSQAFRDLLHESYKSSIDTRRKTRQAKRKRGVNEEHCYVPAKKLHAVAPSNNDDESQAFHKFDTNHRPSSVWLQGKDILLNIEDNEMDWLSKPDEIFSTESAVPTLCCSDMFDSPLFPDQRRDSQILSEALEESFFDDEPACENREPFQQSMSLLQQTKAEEPECIVSSMESQLLLAV